MKEINWDEVEFWVIIIIILVFMGYLIFSGRAWT